MLAEAHERGANKMKKTENFALNQWEPSDSIRRSDFNSDNAAIDAALAANAKALSDYQTANDAAVAKKAEQSAVTALETTVAGKGNCQIAYGTYTGGGNDSHSLSFDIYPLMVMVLNKSDGGDPLTLLRPAVKGGNMTGNSISVTWSNKKVSWSLSGTYGDACDESGTTYAYVAIGVSA